MLDHVSITVSGFASAERFYDATMQALGVVKVGRSDRWLGYGERANAQNPDRVYLAIYRGPKPDEATSRHWYFKAKSRSHVDAFWGAGIAAAAPMAGHPACATTTPPSCVIPTATRSRRFRRE
jgi:hypothetical protein